MVQMGSDWVNTTSEITVMREVHLFHGAERLRNLHCQQEGAPETVLLRVLLMLLK